MHWNLLFQVSMHTISHLGIYYSCIDVNDNTQKDAYEELSHNDTLSRIQVEYDTENRRKWNGQML